jgi:hypothetical protein
MSTSEMGEWRLIDICSFYGNEIESDGTEELNRQDARNAKEEEMRRKIGSEAE